MALAATSRREWRDEDRSIMHEPRPSNVLLGQGYGRCERGNERYATDRPNDALLKYVEPLIHIESSTGGSDYNGLVLRKRTIINLKTLLLVG